MVVALDIQNQAALRGQGYAITEWIGFQTHMVPMYAHHAVADKKVGDIVFTARVGNPKTLNNAEANYFARKGAQGYFPWLPGADCRKRVFKYQVYTPRPGGGSQLSETSKPEQGCKWCRVQPTLAVLSQAPEPAASAPPLASPQVSVSPKPVALSTTPSPEPLPASTANACELCGWQSKKKNTRNALSAHRRHRHSAAAGAIPAAPASAGSA